jgi:hypothetical protein
MDLLQCVQCSSDAAKVQAEEEVGSWRLLVGRLLVSCWLSDTRVVSFGCGPWIWYGGVTEVWGIYIWTGGIEGESRKGEGR